MARPGPQRRVAARRGFAASCLLAASCAPEEDEARYVTEKSELTSFKPLCGWDLAHVDDTVTRIEKDLDATSGDRLTVRVVNDFPIPGCASGASGCSRADGILTLWQSIEHEQAHPIIDRRSSSLAPFWNEGLAEALSGKRTQRGETGPLENLDLEATELNYNTAGHFVRWLWETHGVDAIRRIASGDAFEDVYGITIANASAEYDAEAPWSYPALAPCDYPLLEVDGGSTAAQEIEIDCEADETASFGWFGIGVTHRLDLDQGGTYELRLVGGGGVSFCACQMDILDEPPADKYVGDVISETAGLKVPTPFASDEIHTVELVPGSYRVLPMLDVDEERGTVRLELRRVSE